MFDPTSRYYKIDQATLTVTDPDGLPREIRYVRRRFIPSADEMTTLAEYSMLQGDRLDNVTARFLGDPTQFWRVCDANTVMRPEDLEQIARVVRIALPTS
jgi:hypothetical protein